MGSSSSRKLTPISRKLTPKYVSFSSNRNKTLTTKYSDPVNSVSFSPDGQWIASGSYDYTVRIWNVESGECVRTLEGHSGEVSSVSFSPDGTRVASGSWADSFYVAWTASVL
jgi:WD40 repeat protein